MHIPTVAIVILNYNGRHYLQQFLPSVLASTYSSKRVIVADNASTDDSVEWLAVSHPSVELIVLPKNYGFAKGYNEALKKVDAEYYILLNSDVEVLPGWIEPAVERMNADTSIAACQPKMLDYNNRHKFEYAGAAGGWMDALGYPFSRGRVFDTCEQDLGQYDLVEEIFWASGAAFFVRASVFHQLFGFDEFFFAHQEEIDLCWRMQLSGYRIIACPESVVYHVGGGTLPNGERKTFLNFRNNLVMAYKNWQFAERLWKMPLRIILDFVSAAKALLAGDVAFFTGVLKGEFGFLQWLFSKKDKRYFIKNRKANLRGLYSGSIVWAYFLKKKKRFAEIVLAGKGKV